MSVLVLGGGITGLSAAHFLRTRGSVKQMTVVNATDSLKGWLRTDRPGPTDPLTNEPASSISSRPEPGVQGRAPMHAHRLTAVRLERLQTVGD